MASPVDIANRALTMLGAARITSLSDNRKEAREINAVYEQVRDEELRRYNWNFAIKRAALAALTDPPPFGFNLQYRVPADFMRAIQVGDIYPAVNLSDVVGLDDSAYAIENDGAGRVIRTNMGAPLNLRYVARIEDSTVYDPLFVGTLAAKLAMEVAESLSASTNKVDQASRNYRMAVAEAVRCNAIEKPPVKLADDTWIASRQ